MFFQSVGDGCYGLSSFTWIYDLLYLWVQGGGIAIEGSSSEALGGGVGGWWVGFEWVEGRGGGEYDVMEMDG